MEITRLKTVFGITSLFAVAVYAAHAQEDRLPHVSVYGTAEIKAVPDEMHWTLSVQSRGQDVSQVAEAHDKKVASVLEFLKQQQIEDKKVQTSRIQLSENWVYRGRERVKEGYLASTRITFESASMDQYKKLWMGIAALPDVSVNGVTFDTSERIKYQNEARLRAVSAAKVKAEALAKALDSSIHEPILIEEISPRIDVFETRNTGVTMAAAAGQAASVAPGTISITTRVQVKFRISSP